MHAIVKEKQGAGYVIYKEVPEPYPAKDEVKIKIKFAGVCGTDIHIYHDRFPFIPPVTLGHEFSGVVVEVGADVKEFKVGDRVTAEVPARICNTCEDCRTGNYNHCANRLGMGNKVNGCFADYCVAEEKMTHRLPDNIDFKEAALCEPLSCVARVFDLTKIRASDFVVVTGPGAIGLLTMQIAKAEGAAVTVIGTGADKQRLTVAKELGADYTLNLEELNVVEEINRLTEGRGADVVLECSGSEGAANTCLEILKKRGRYTQVGLFGKKISLDFEKVSLREYIVTGSKVHTWKDWEKALRLLKNGKIKLAPLITAEYPMSKWQEAFNNFESKKGIKTIMYPNEL